MILEVDDVTARYGPITVLREVSMSVAPGPMLGVLGRNGMASRRRSAAPRA
jgi:ABC-type branched-subunit amino acid transport system ATPase component